MTTMSIQPARIGSGDDITTMSTSTMTEIEIKKKRVCTKRKVCGGDTTNTSTVIAKKRKDCGGINTPAVTETKKKRPYRGKNCGGDTNTSTVMETKKKKRKDCGDTTSTPTVSETMKIKDCGNTVTPTVTEKKKRAYRRKKYLPHDLIMEEILTKLPVTTLLKSVLVSKLWYNSIHNDHKRLTYSHFLQSQKKPEVIFSLLNVREGVTKNGEPSYGCHLFKFTTGIYSSYDNVLRFDKFRGALAQRDIWELVGYCNGMPCMAQVGEYSNAYIILDPNRDDFLYMFYPASVGKCIFNAHIICHGFGFDPSANEYKLVSIYRTIGKEINVVVFTLGTKSWRNVTATSMPRSGRPITKIRVPTGSDKSAIICSTSSSGSGCLAWKITGCLEGPGSSDIQHDNSNTANNEMEMLLSFDLHDEKFQFIQLPAKITTDEQKNLLVDYPHLLEFKGSPCIARIEKMSVNESDYPHRCLDDHKGSGSCCCCCKVHLYVLKDKVKQVWVKEESFDVRINSTPTWLRNVGHLAPEPCCFCIGTATPPTRIFSFSNQMFLYWFNGKCLQVYNLRSEKLQLVEPSYSKEDAIFGDKMKEPRHILNSVGDDSYCSIMDYQLHCHEENFFSLETFIPQGVEGVHAADFSELDLVRPCSAFVSIERGSKMIYPSLN